jgi:hypothetical protein
MKNALGYLAAILLSFGLIGPAFAQALKATESSPKDTGGPEMRQQKSQETKRPDGAKHKKPDASIDERKGKNAEAPPMGIEGTEARKAKKREASAKPQKPKAAEGPDGGKDQKKP